MLWTKTKSYEPEPFEKEADLESAIHKVKAQMFGSSRIYIDVKKKIGQKGKKQKLPVALG